MEFYKVKMLGREKTLTALPALKAKVGTVKKSIAAMTSLQLRRKTSPSMAGSGLRPDQWSS